MDQSDNKPKPLSDKQLERISAAGILGKIGKALGGLGRVATGGLGGKGSGSSDK